MRSMLKRVLFLTSALALVGAASQADAAGTARTVSRHGAPWLEVHARAPRPASRVAPLTTKVLESRARRVVGTSAVTLLAGPVDRLGDGDSIVHFSQVHQGLPVIGRGATVRFDAAGEPLLVARDLATVVPESVVPQLSADAVRARVSASDTSTTGLVIWPLRGGGTRLAWVVLPSVLPGTPRAPRIVVDARSGEILEARDLIRFATAQVYATNPVTSPITSAESLALDPTEGRLSNPLLRSLNCIDKKSVKPFDVFGIKGNAHLCDLEQTAEADEGGAFDYTPSDEPGSVAARSDTYAEVSMYYHAAKAYAFFRGLSGEPEAQVVEDKPLHVVANLQLPAGLLEGDLKRAENPELPLEPFSNAFFSPASGGLGDIFGQLFGVKGGGLWFGQGPQRDYAYDGDVIYHEFTHAVVDVTLRLGAWHLDAYGAIDAPGAMNEGLADYFAAAITGDPNIGEYASQDLGTGDVIRTLANNDACPANVVGEVHVDSTLFSGALWQGRSALTADQHTKFDAAIYKAMRSHPGADDLGFEDLANLFLATMDTDLPAASAGLRAAFEVRGILPNCHRVLELTPGLPFTPSNDTYPGIAAPGGPSLGVSGIAPGVLQFHAAVRADAAKLDVSFDRRDLGGITGILSGARPFQPEILVKFGAPITWTFERNEATSNADLSVDGTATTTTIDIPAGTTDVYVQIANRGQTDGLLGNVKLDFQSAPPQTPTETPVAVNESDDGGCGCSTPGSTSPVSGALPFVGVAVLAGAIARRRNKTRPGRDD